MQTGKSSNLPIETMSAEVNVLKRAVDPLTTLLSGFDLSITFKNDQAQTMYDTRTGKPVRMILPILPGDADAHVIAAFHGYIDHEVGHVLYTDISDFHKELDSRMLKTFFNIVEDIRIERCMCERFVGSRFNLARLHEMAFPESQVTEMKKPETDDEMVSAVINGALYACRALGGQDYFKRQLMMNPILKWVYEKIEEEVGAKPFSSMKSSKDALALAKRLIELFEIKEVSSSQQSESEEDDGESAEGQESQEGDQSSDGEKKSSKKQKKSKKRSSESKDEGEENKEGKSNSEDKANPNQAELSDEKPDDVYEELIKHILKKKTEDIQKNLSYSVYTTDEDVIEPMPSSNNFDALRRLEDKTAQMTNVIQKNLQRAISARSLVTWNGGLRRGRLQSSALYKLSVGDDRVFRKKVEGISKDVAISLVIDCSGSMNGDCIETAATAAFAMGNVLSQMGINFEVIGFTTKGQINWYHDFSRWDGIYMPVFKSFSDRWGTQSKLRLAELMLKPEFLCQNVDGESIQIAANRLMAQPEVRKIMLVLSDGYPHSDGNNEELRSHLARTVKELEKIMTVVGIGIGDDSSASQYYDKHVVLTNIDDLPGIVIHKIRDLLLA